MSAYSPETHIDNINVTDTSIVFIDNSTERVEFIPHTSITNVERTPTTLTSCITTPPYYLLLLPLIYLGGIKLIAFAPTMMMFHATITTALTFPFIITTYSIQQKLRAHIEYDDRIQIITNAGDIYHVYTDSETATQIATKLQTN